MDDLLFGLVDNLSNISKLRAGEHVDPEEIDMEIILHNGIKALEPNQLLGVYPSAHMKVVIGTHCVGMVEHYRWHL